MSLLARFLHPLPAIKQAVAAVTINSARSSEWPAVERQHLLEHPTCAACGSSHHPQVHHILPFHLDRALELAPTNLVTLCMDPGFDCHLLIGHGDSFRAYNPHLVDYLAILKQWPDMRAAIIHDSKANRLFALEVPTAS